MRDLDAFLESLLPAEGKGKSKEALFKSYAVYQAGKHFSDAMKERAHYAAVSRVPNRQKWLAEAFTRCMEEAVTEFADWLTQALIARNKPITRQRVQMIVEESLQFASYYTARESTDKWLAAGLGLENEEAEEVRGLAGISFRTLILGATGRWAEQAEARIRFRCLLSARPARPQSLDDRTKVVIRQIKGDNPGITQKDLCRKLDAMNDRAQKNIIPVPKTWEEKGERSWCGALANPKLKGPVKTYLSKINAAPRRRKPQQG
jgi:hypothetical protein